MRLWREITLEDCDGDGNYKFLGGTIRVKEWARRGKVVMAHKEGRNWIVRITPPLKIPPLKVLEWEEKP